MKHLLDVNVLLASIWTDHPQYSAAFAWLNHRRVVLCPLVELGFLRISTNKKAMAAPMEKARELLQKFYETRKAERIHDDLPALESNPNTSDQVTDSYLAELAHKHGLKLATFDTGIMHASVELVSKSPPAQPAAAPKTSSRSR